MADSTLSGPLPGEGRIRILSRKWDGSQHRDNEADVLGDDEHGRWLWMPDGTPVDGPGGVWLARAGLRLFPLGGQWWSAFFVPADLDRPQQLYVDITTPASMTPSLVEFIDLDLDVEIIGESSATVLDEDEFEAHRVDWAYPEAVVVAARRTADTMLAAMAGSREPFGTAWRRWLGVARERYPGGAADLRLRPPGR